MEPQHHPGCNLACAFRNKSCNCGLDALHADRKRLDWIAQAVGVHINGVWDDEDDNTGRDLRAALDAARKSPSVPGGE